MQSTIQHYKRTHILKLEKGDLLLESINSYATKLHITAGHFSGIGALQVVHIGYFDTTKKIYKPITHHHVEIIACLGNISIKQDTRETIVHTHIAVSDKNGITFSGHLNPGSKISVTAEIFLTELQGPLHRTRDTHTGLHLMDDPDS